MRFAALPLAALLSGCTLAMPFRVPEGAHRPDPAATVVVALTQAEVDPAQQALFDRYVKSVLADLPRQPGLVGYSLRRNLPGDRVWTLTVWKDEPARAAFVASPAHRAAMAAAMPALKSARFARREVPAREAPPRWAEALQWLATSGRGYGPAS